MDLKKIALFFVFADFTAYSLWVVANGGSIGEIVGLFSVNPWIGQVSLDLVIALSMVLVWIYRDARAHGRNPIPWIVATLFTGSIATLAYFAFRPTGETAPVLDAGHSPAAHRA